jgi:hypothetical protein
LPNQLNINVTGGQNDFGNIVQGDHNTVHAEVRHDVVARRFDELREAIATQGERRGEPAPELQELKTRVSELQAALQAGADSRAAKPKLQAIIEKFSWAVPLVKNVLDAFYPGLLDGVMP